LDTKDVTSQAEVIRALREFAHAEVFKGWRKMLTGRRTATNTITLAGAPAGKTWVRAHDASREQTAVWGFVGIPNVTVYVAPGVDGDNRIMAIDYAESVQSHGSKVVLAQQPPLDGNLNTVIVAGRNILPGRVRPYADSGSMLVYIEPFAHHEGRYAGGTIDLTSDIPATAGTCAWVAVALDPATDTLYSYAGSESYDVPANLDEADAHAISIPDGYIPLAAVVLEEGMTEITAATRIVDLRPHFYARGYPALDSLANVDTTGKADGSALVWDAGNSQWEIGVVSGTSEVAVSANDTTPDYLDAKLVAGTGITLTENNDGGNETLTITYNGSAPSSDYILIRDEKSSGTTGGTFTTGAWQTRDLNTEVTDAGGHASISSNQITLAAGTYQCRIACPAYAVNTNQARLYDITNSAELVLGQNTYGTTGNGSTALVVGEFTLAGSTVVEVQHRCSYTGSYGVAGSWGTEVYTVAEFWKVG
jgi:hypothetical protein